MAIDRFNLTALTAALLVSISFTGCTPVPAKSLLSVPGHELPRTDDKPFYWLADTAWDVLYATDSAELSDYARIRHDQGFNVTLIQLVGGEPRARNRLGQASVSFDANDRIVANPDFLQTARRQIRQLNEAGLKVAIVATWGYNVRMGKFDVGGARRFGETVGRALGAEDVIWLVGGDENPTPQTIPIWRAMAEGLETGSPKSHLMSYHPSGGSTSQWFRDQPWLNFNAIQSGHSRYRPQIKSISGMIRSDFAIVPPKPVIDLESGYEYIPDGLYRLHPAGLPVDDGDRIDAYDIRVRAYLQYVSGAFGYTYGHLDVVKFWSEGRPQKWPGEISWKKALYAPGAMQMSIYQAVRKRLGSPYLVPNDEIVPPSGRIPDYARTLAGCTPDGRKCLIYTASGVAFPVFTASIGKSMAFTWIDPRSGVATRAVPDASSTAELTFTPPGDGPGDDDRAFIPKQGERSMHDWLLVIEPTQMR